MADHPDLEKQTARNTTISTTAPSSTMSSKNEKGANHSHTNSSAYSHDADSINSDPLSPLERALTPDLRIPSEQTAQYTDITNPATFTLTQTRGSVATTASRLPTFEIDFPPSSPHNPKNWPLWYRSMTIAFMSFATWSVILFSTSYTSGMPGMMEEFGITSEPVATLGVTTYLLGIACGALVLAPLSEVYGRRPIYCVSLGIFVILVLPCALAENLTTVVVVRFFSALAGSAMIANSPGTIADISSDSHRALAFSFWSIGPMNGPVTGPIIGGFTYEYLGWRWTNWLVMIIAGLAWILAASIKESYAPALLRAEAAKRRKETGDDRYWSRYDSKASVTEILKTNLSRPFVLTFTEPILWFWDLYIGVVYGILYLCFVAYPIIYTDDRGWNPGMSGLAFCGIGLGSMIAILGEPLFRRLINSHKKDPETGAVPPEASVIVVCIAAVLAPIGQLWFSWTSYPTSIHWIWGILAGIPFGCGNTMIFIYASNYIAGAYGIYAASAMAGNSVVRSLFGGTLPLAGAAMYAALGPRWAGTLLGVLEVVLIPIPFAFYFYGDRIREASPLIRRMREDTERNEARTARRAARGGRMEGGELEKAVSRGAEKDRGGGIGGDFGIAASSGVLVEDKGLKPEAVEEIHETRGAEDKV